MVDSGSEKPILNLVVSPMTVLDSDSYTLGTGGVESYRLITAVSSDDIPDLSVTRKVIVCSPEVSFEPKECENESAPERSPEKETEISPSTNHSTEETPQLSEKSALSITASLNDLSTIPLT